MIGIYKITNPNGKIYIGQSINIYNRWRQYKKLYKNIKSQKLLYRSLSKYGFEKHIFEIVEECEKQYLNCRERYWQDHFNVIDNNGLNLTLTGNNNHYTEPKTIPSKVILDYETGIYFYSIKDAALSYNIKLSIMRSYLYDEKRNKTNLRPVNCNGYINKLKYKEPIKPKKINNINNAFIALNVPCHYFGLLLSDIYQVIKYIIITCYRDMIDFNSDLSLFLLNKVMNEKFKLTNMFHDYIEYLNNKNNFHNIIIIDKILIPISY